MNKYYVNVVNEKCELLYSGEFYAETEEQAWQAFKAIKPGLNLPKNNETYCLRTEEEQRRYTGRFYRFYNGEKWLDHVEGTTLEAYYSGYRWNEYGEEEDFEDFLADQIRYYGTTEEVSPC